MRNFVRAVRLTLRQRWSVAGTFLCATAIALLWGGSISAIYPLVETVLRAETLHDWINYRVRYGKQTLLVFEEQLEVLSQAQHAAAWKKKQMLLQNRCHALQQRSEKSRALLNEINELEKLLQITAGPDLQRALQYQIEDAQDRVRAETKELQWVRWLQPYIHTFMPDNPFETLLLIIIITLAITFVKGIFLIASALLVARLAQRTTLQLRQDFYDKTLQMDLSNFGRQGHGDLTSRFTGDVTALSDGIKTLFGSALREPLKMVACLVGAALVCWRLLILSLLIAPLAAWMVHWLAKSLKRANRRAMEEMAQIYNRLSETLSGIKVVKAFTMESYEKKRFAGIANQYYHKAMKIARYNSLIRPMNEMFGMIIISLAILVGAYLSLSHETHLFGIKISDRRLTTGACLVFYGLLAGISDPARKLSGVFSRLQAGAAAGDRIYAILDQQSTILDPPHARPFPCHQKSLVFDNVSFCYQPQQPVLQNIHLTVAFGETLAVVGPNGSGKSTLANLVLRFFDPVQGSVKVDGLDLREIRQQDLRRQIGLVTQETLLFDDTVCNNIRYGTPDASDYQVFQASRQAHAHHFIKQKLADGYDTRVGPGGQRISGGQRQRISLARAILRNPSILILDEATSQIDLESEQLIQKVLEKFVRQRTAIIITHRLTTLALADRIVVMDHGCILDVGTHKELLQRSDVYRRLHEIQMKKSA